MTTSLSWHAPGSSGGGVGGADVREEAEAERETVDVHVERAEESALSHFEELLLQTASSSAGARLGHASIALSSADMPPLCALARCTGTDWAAKLGEAYASAEQTHAAVAAAAAQATRVPAGACATPPLFAACATAVLAPLAVCNGSGGSSSALRSQPSAELRHRRCAGSRAAPAGSDAFASALANGGSISRDRWGGASALAPSGGHFEWPGGDLGISALVCSGPLSPSLSLGSACMAQPLTPGCSAVGSSLTVAAARPLSAAHVPVGAAGASLPSSLRPYAVPLRVVGSPGQSPGTTTSTSPGLSPCSSSPPDSPMRRGSEGAPLSKLLCYLMLPLLLPGGRSLCVQEASGVNVSVRNKKND
ncbi:hypothetical protein T492DRAFT_139805 [Pavlovales sp. CCMP2436]|nr:hypothetical protein T492DRAFT_139805 [Pavlovales sp. CCMP2436]